MDRKDREQGENKTAREGCAGSLIEIMKEES
jgi:hypothetical protein